MLFFPSRQERCFLVPSHCGSSPDVYTYVPSDSSGAFLELLGAVLWGYLTSETSKLTRRTKVRIGGVWEITQLVYVYFFLCSVGDPARSSQVISHQKMGNTVL